MAPPSHPPGTKSSTQRPDESKTVSEQPSKRSSAPECEKASASLKPNTHPDPPPTHKTRTPLAADEYDSDNITLAKRLHDATKKSQDRPSEVVDGRVKGQRKVNVATAPSLAPATKTTATGALRRKGVAYPVKRAKPKTRIELVTTDEGEEEEERGGGKERKGGKGLGGKRRHRAEEDEDDEEGEEITVKGGKEKPKGGKERKEKKIGGKEKETKKKRDEDGTPAKKLKMK